MNRACLVGRLTAKPELKYTNSNLPVTRFSIAVDRRNTDNTGKREADFINIVAWRKTAENVCNYLDKGSLISVEGRIQTGSYDGTDGKKRYTFEVVADNVTFLESKAQSQARTNSATPYDFAQPEPSAQVAPATKEDVSVNNDPFADFGDNVSIDDDFLE